MASSKNSAGRCCSMESKNLKEQLRGCDYCSTSVAEHNACYQRAAKESGARARSCVTGGSSF